MKRTNGLGNTVLRYLGVYRVYTRLLEGQIRNGPVPRHIGVILDGNRRWAQERDFPSWVGHAFGADRVESLLEWCLEYHVKTLTLYVLSTENLAREPDELRQIFEVIEARLQKLLDGRYVHKHKVHVKMLGNADILPEGVKSRLRELEKESSEYSDLYLNFAIAYGGRMEILQAVRRVAEDVSKGSLDPLDIDEKKFSGYLFTSFLPDPDPELIIRTSGEVRLSGFLIWQSAYSELVFMDVYWPGFRKLDFLRAIRTYQSRQRRFGR